MGTEIKAAAIAAKLGAFAGGAPGESAKTAERVAPAATARRDQSAPAPPRRPMSPWRPVTNKSSSGTFSASRPTAVATAPGWFAWKASTSFIGAA